MPSTYTTQRPHHAITAITSAALIATLAVAGGLIITGTRDARTAEVAAPAKLGYPFTYHGLLGAEQATRVVIEDVIANHLTPAGRQAVTRRYAATPVYGVTWREQLDQEVAERRIAVALGGHGGNPYTPAEAGDTVIAQANVTNSRVDTYTENYAETYAFITANVNNTITTADHSADQQWTDIITVKLEWTDAGWRVGAWVVR